MKTEGPRGPPGAASRAAPGGGGRRPSGAGAGSLGLLGALAAVAWRVGWSGPGRATVLAFTVGRGVAAARTGPDRVGEGLDPGVGQVVPSPQAGDSTPAGG
jgi:hypothetical protein